MTNGTKRLPREGDVVRMNEKAHPRSGKQGTIARVTFDDRDDDTVNIKFMMEHNIPGSGRGNSNETDGLRRERMNVEPRDPTWK